jgi:hypothetical protein
VIESPTITTRGPEDRGHSQTASATTTAITTATVSAVRVVESGRRAERGDITR